MSAMRILIKGLKGLWYFIWGHLFAVFFYDSNYLHGRWFTGKMHGLCCLGWEWVVHDAMARMIFSDNKNVHFPVAHGCRVIHPENIDFEADDLNNFQTFGVYYLWYSRLFQSSSVRILVRT